MARTKVMINAQGIPRIQVEDGDSIKIYSFDAWKKLNEQRPESERVDIVAANASGPVADSADDDADDDADHPLIQDDEEDDEPARPALAVEEE